jgi:hypothetical protein
MSTNKVLFRAREVLGSNVGPETGYTDGRFSRFPQSLQATDGLVPKIRPRPHPPLSYPIDYLLIILSLNPKNKMSN